MKRTQFVTLSLENLKDRLQNPATLNGPVVWTSADPAIAEVVVEGDVTKAVARGIGETTITAKGDASSDEGDQPFQATGGVQVTSGDVAEGTVVFGAPQEQ